MSSSTKHCSSCGRPMENLEKLERNLDVKYCSKLCRKEKLDKVDVELEAYILKRLLDVRPSNICPSQISRERFGDEWKQHHQSVVKASRRLMLRDKILITQKKKKVSTLNFKGPIRIQLKTLLT